MFTTRAALTSFFVALAATSSNMGVVMADGGEFSYNPAAANGPANWAALAIDSNACGGQKNSPIAVTTGKCDRFEDYTFSDGTCSAGSLSYSLTNTGVKASYPADGACENPTVVIPGIEGTYKALQFHIHTSSEHTIDGMFFGAELHTVHQQIDGDRYAVVGMMIQPDADVENESFEALLQGWASVFDANESACATSRGDGRKLADGADKDATATVSARKLEGSTSNGSAFSPYQLIPDGATYYHYDGGLTTPPCSEVVWWNLADKPVSISPSQYARLINQVLNYIDPNTCALGTVAGPVGSTSRPVQPLNGRTVERICPVGFQEEETTDSKSSPNSGGKSSVSTLGVVGIAAVAGAAMLL